MGFSQPGSDPKLLRRGVITVSLVCVSMVQWRSTGAMLLVYGAFGNGVEWLSQWPWAAPGIRACAVS